MSTKTTKIQKKRRAMRRVECYIITTAILLTTIAGCRPPQDGSDSGEFGNGTEASGNEFGGLVQSEVQAVEALLINREEFFGAVEASGVVRGIQEATIVSETSGAIESVRVRLGEAVAKGDVLVTLDDSLERFAVEQARDQLSVSEIEFAATQILYESGNSSEAALARAKSMVSGNRSLLAQAKRRLGNRVIAAPVSGRIAVIPESISEGNFIQLGTVIASVVNMERVRIDIGLGEREIRMVNVGDRVRVYSDACGPEPQTATVRALAAGSAGQSGTFTVNIEFPNRCGDTLRSGMSALVEITNANQAATIVVPAQALVRDRGKVFVFIASQDGNGYFAQQREIETTRILGDRVEVASGLNTEEILIVAPVQTLEDGVEVNPTTIRGLTSLSQ